MSSTHFSPVIARPRLTRNRIIYGILVGSVLLLGLASRRFLGDYSFVKLYVGDALWALMVYFGGAFVFRRWTISAVATATLGFSVGIELSQLYHAPWIDSLRATRLGGLILGFSFVWSDLLCYVVGVGLGVLIETYAIPVRYRGGYS
ncbi:DUF2809 domain-containing protein [Spirosoma sp. KUDC1026]|uniref:ribosomal maturation YjgA family protein n=1 Tax=Spirosoma sp. KUDC1026 TaxID=2745947 RepID=UPI00159BED12|nr:DUF2809 domain-containing protein [Spirosoma sp. KUDC1026]QKZ13375.1 DUF2809 domain-containing protein [Spirosoma sp. KUDC1026]